jgi:hypothetical protein
VDHLVRTGQYERLSVPFMASRVGCLLLFAMPFVFVFVFAPLAALLLAGAGGLAISLLRSLPPTTRRAERAAREWRAVRSGLLAATPGAVPYAVLDAALPHAVAMGALDAVDQQVSAGYRPAVLGSAPPHGDERAWRGLVVALLLQQPLRRWRDRRALAQGRKRPSGLRWLGHRQDERSQGQAQRSRA